MKKLCIFVLLLSLLVLPLPAGAAEPEVNAKAAVLMEKTSGEILFEQNAHEALEPASVTKVMTLLLIMEALDSGALTEDAMVSVSARAAGMGGSQVYLKEGEQFSVQDMLKAIAVASGNDAAVAMAEHLAGSEEAFVEKMNEKAAELGMQDTCFLNCTGLPAEGHHTSAWDIALMSRELILKHPGIRAYSSIWMDSLRGGAFQLVNTNKLIRFYEGATGLKTGSTDSALYCLSATAERDGMELIAVILGSPTSADRFESAKALLNFGFAGFALVTAAPSEPLSPLPVTMGTVPSVMPVCGESAQLLLPKSDAGNLTTTVSLPDSIEAPVEKGQELGHMTVHAGERVLTEIPLLAAESVPRLTLFQIYAALLSSLFCAETGQF